MSIFRSRNARIILSIALGLALIVAAYPALHAAQGGQGAQPDQNMPAVGSAAPDFTLPSQEGTKISLHDFKGKWVVLYFYPKDMTSGCTIEAHGFQRDLAQYDAKNAVILGVSVDSVDSHKEFCAKDSLTFKLLSDTSHDVVQKYGSLRTATMQDGSSVAYANRNTFLINPKGEIAKVYTKVNPTPHSADVLGDITTMQAAK
jgi:thioredoxin-dependent peroxiredoxin